MDKTEKNTADALFIKMVMLAWQNQNSEVNKLLDALSDEQLSAQTAPGRNSGVYLLGHLAAVNDNLFKILNLGERLHPELDPTFLDNPEHLTVARPSIDELKKYWNEINSRLAEYFKDMEPADWFSRHMLVSEEDFSKEPHRNKLNVLMNRTAHQSYHFGQMAYLKRHKAASPVI